MDHVTSRAVLADGPHTFVGVSATGLVSAGRKRRRRVAARILHAQFDHAYQRNAWWWRCRAPGAVECAATGRPERPPEKDGRRERNFQIAPGGRDRRCLRDESACRQQREVFVGSWGDRARRAPAPRLVLTQGVRRDGVGAQKQECAHPGDQAEGGRVLLRHQRRFGGLSEPLSTAVRARAEGAFQPDAALLRVDHCELLS